MKNVKVFLATLALFGLSLSAAMSQSSTYTITNNGANFDLVKDGITPLMTSEPYLYYVMLTIRDDADGADCTIQFGDGGVLNMDEGFGRPSIMFNGTWGEITFTGKATTAWEYPYGIIQVGGDITVNCEAELTATSYYPLFYNYGTLNINGSKVENTAGGGAVVYNEGTLTINNATVQVTGGNSTAIENADGTVTIGGNSTVQATNYGSVAISQTAGETTVSGTALIASANAVGTSGTIVISGGTLTIDGGTVENTADNGRAIYNTTGAVDISGGTVQTTGISSRTIEIYPTGTLTISGGTVQSIGGFATISHISTGTINISGGTVSASSNFAIMSEYGGMVNISGGTISSAGGTALYSNYGGCTLNISGGTLQATGTYGKAIELFVGETTVSGTALVTSENSSSTSGTILFSGGTLTITGGTVENTAEAGKAIYNNSTETVTITGGIIFAYGTGSADVIHGIYDQSGDAVIVAWDKDAGTTTYEAGTSEDIYKLPAIATAVWASKEGIGGISVDYGTTTGFIPIAGVIVGTTAIEAITNDGLLIYPNPTCDVLNFSLETSFEIIDLQGKVLLKSDKAVNSVNINGLPSGTYFVILTAERGKIVKKIIKE